MIIPQLAISLIKKYEGFSERVYLCPAGLKTIGYGHVIQKNEQLPLIIDIQYAEQLLLNDISKSVKAIAALISVPLTINQIASLISFTFNLGCGALERSTLRQKLNRNEYLEAADEFTKWVYIGSTKIQGLVNRRSEERRIFIGWNNI
jgi:lysozyme